MSAATPPSATAIVVARCHPPPSAPQTEHSAALRQSCDAHRDLERFGKAVKLAAFKPFTSAADALENINAVSEASLSDGLSAFLEQNLPKVKAGKKPKFVLGVYEPKLGSAIQESLGVPCVANELTSEMLRGVRQHFDRFVKGLADGALKKAQLGLAHSYSRAKVKFNVNKVDNMIIQVRLFPRRKRLKGTWRAKRGRRRMNTYGCPSLGSSLGERFGDGGQIKYGWRVDSRGRTLEPVHGCRVINCTQTGRGLGEGNLRAVIRQRTVSYHSWHQHSILGR